MSQNDYQEAQDFLPIVHFDRRETIPLRAIGYTVFHETSPSISFPGRKVQVREGETAIEYAYYWDYDIQHMYDLEHIWVWLDEGHHPVRAQGSFHGKYLNLFGEGLEMLQPDGGHIHAFCQPGKHAFLPSGDLFCLVPGWFESCNTESGGPVLLGSPFSAAHREDARDAFRPTAEDHLHSIGYIRSHLAFEPSLSFREDSCSDVPLMTWAELQEKIPSWIFDECRRLSEIYS